MSNIPNPGPGSPPGGGSGDLTWHGPVPSGTPASNPRGTEAVADYLDKAYPRQGAGAAWSSFAGRDTHAPYDILITGFYIDWVAAHGIAGAVGAGASGLGSVVGGIGHQTILGLKPPSPLAGIDEVGAVLEGAFNALTDVNMWRSLGYLALGVVLLVMGVRLWLGKPALPAAPTVVPVPV